MGFTVIAAVISEALAHAEGCGAHLFETVDCPLCGGGAHEPVTGPMRDEEGREGLDEPFRSMTFRMVRCSACDLVYLRERPRPEELRRFYSSEYHCYESYVDRGLVFEMLAELVTSQKLTVIRRHFPPGAKTLLDYGCGSGTWLAMFKKRGVPWELVGTEIMEAPLAQLRAQGIQGYVCDERSLLQHVAEGSVGVVHLFHVIEHVPDPVGVLRTLMRALAPGGVIYGQTPDHDCWEAKLFGDYWSQWHFPRHFAVFTPKTLRDAAEKAGLEVVAIKPSLSGATQWALSFLKKRAVERDRPFRLTGEPLYPLLTLAAIPLAALQVGVSSTSHMDFILRRPHGG